MSAAPSLIQFGAALTPRDYALLTERWISPELADAAGLRRVDALTARDIVGRKAGAGISIPNILPGASFSRANRIRLDDPIGKAKYLSEVGRPGLAYFPPMMPAHLMADADIPSIITEGEFKTLALWRLSTHETAVPRFMSLGFPGVWNWRGTIGKMISANGDRIDEKGVIVDVDRVQWTDRKVIIAFDADAESKESVRIARAHLARVLRGRGAKVAFLEWDIAEGKGIDDRLAKVGPEKVLSDIQALDFERRDWRANLISNKDGNPRALLANAITALREAPEWSGVIAFDEFSLRTVALKPTPWGTATEWTDHEDRLTTDWLQHNGIFVSVEVAGQAVQAVARDRRLHPVKEYLESLKWDGTKRLDTWLSEYLGAEMNDYTAAVGARWLISAVARIFRPGCKADCCLILEGAQGLLKSTALKTLAEPWFTDEIADLGSKDAAMQTRGVWVIEIAELDSMNRPEIARVKAFMSRMADRFRPPYGKRLIESSRQCVFAGSVNQNAYLKDETGARRFWPVACTRILIHDLARDRDQLWAEAVERFKQGASWWLDSADLNRAAEYEQSKRYDGDAWDESIRDWVENLDSVSIPEVLCMCIGKEKSTWTQADQNRVARSLRSIGWKRFQQNTGGIRKWGYRKP